MRELLDRAGGEPMTPGDCRSDVDHHCRTAGTGGVWTLQRRQDLRQPGDAGWEAFARGDRAGALRLLEAQRETVAGCHRRITEQGFTVQWVRVVEEPLTPHLQWELHVLRLHEQCGSRVRVVRPRHVRALEAAGPLPEIRTLGAEVMYEYHYDESGTFTSARRYTDRDLIERCQRVLADLHACGEPLADYVARELVDPSPPARRIRA